MWDITLKFPYHVLSGRDVCKKEERYFRVGYNRENEVNQVSTRHGIHIQIIK